MRKFAATLNAEIIIASSLGVLALLLVTWMFQQIPIEGTSLAIDWQGLWAGLKDGHLKYGSGMFNPPWAMLLILPIGFLPMRIGWGLITFMTLAVLIVSVPVLPQRRLRLLAIFLLCTSYPTLRHFADGNFEGLIIAGILLILYSFSKHSSGALILGVILATAKFQETWLFILVMAYYLVRTWPPQKWRVASGIIFIIVGGSLIWKGAEWWQASSAMPFRGSVIDVTILAAVNRLHWPIGFGIVVWALVLANTIMIVLVTPPTLSRVKTGLLIAASMLVGPYAAGNSFLTVLAIGLIPIFLTRPIIGTLLLVLTNLPFLFSKDIAFNYSAYYWTAMLLLTYTVCALIVWRTERLTPTPPLALVSSAATQGNVQ